MAVTSHNNLPAIVDVVEHIAALVLQVTKQAVVTTVISNVYEASIYNGKYFPFESPAATDAVRRLPDIE